MRISHEFFLSINSSNVGIRLDKALSQHEQIESRSQASKLIAWELVSINGQLAKASRVTILGETYLVRFPEKEIKELIPYDFKLKILHEDADVIVVDKPPGLVVHPAAGHYNDTLVNALIHHTNSLAAGFEAHRPGLVHRLDKDTSGILVVAKNEFSHRKLAAQFKAKTAERIYWAVVFGKLIPPFGRFQSYLRRHPSNRMKFVSDITQPGCEPTGKLAITDYKVLAETKAVSLIQLQLQTGRTHQIRVHLSEKGHYILGDPIYGPKQLPKSIQSVERLMLHARTLGFLHPRTDIFLRFTSDGSDFGFSIPDFGLVYEPKA